MSRFLGINSLPTIEQQTSQCLPEKPGGRGGSFLGAVPRGEAGGQQRP